MKKNDSGYWGRTGVLLATWSILALGALGATAAPVLNIVPWPQTVVTQAGTFSLSATTKVVPATPALQTLATVLTNEFSLAFGLTMAVDANATGSGNILLQLTNTLSNEAYHVTVTAAGAVVEAGNYAAVAAGSVSLLQAVSSDGTQATIPCFSISDAPFASYRGLMIDCSRQPHSVATLEQLIQLCRLYKIRYLQLHLTDDQGFMFPSTNFPLLSTQNQSGPAYSRADLQELESYSQARGVTIIPELEIPGHEGTMVSTMPDLFEITGTSPYIEGSTLNWAKPEVTNALDTLIGEMLSVFQSTPYFHIGGDEADYSLSYQNTNFIQQFQTLGYALPYDGNDSYQLYRRLLRNLSNLITNKYGRQMLCWEGFNEDNSPQPLEPVPKTIPVMAFENTYYPANLLVADGYPVINTAWNPLYVVNGTQCSPEHIYGWNMYQFGRYQPDWNQVTWITVPTNSPQVIGAQMCAWEQPESIEITSLRLRVAAMSERIWNPRAGKTYTDFSNRVAAADMLVTAITGRGWNPPLINVGGTYVNPNSIIGSGNAANLTNNTTFGWQTGNCPIPAVLNGFTLTFDSGGGNALDYTGVISSNGAVVFNSSSGKAIQVGGDSANTYTGSTLVNFGWVSLEKPDDLDALLGNITVGGSSAGWLTWTTNNQINDSANVSVTANGSYLNLAGFSDAFNKLTLPAGTYLATGLGTNNFMRVSTLVMGGTTYTTGAFGASTPGGYVTGSGYILVGGTPPPVVTQPPDPPSSPSPPNGATEIQPLYPTLSWANSSGATSYDFYLWLAANSQPSTPTASGLTVVQYAPANILSNLTAYKWQVVAKNSAGSSTGAVWTFTTRLRTDISNVLTPWEPANPSLGVNIDYQVGTGNTGRLVGLTQTHWASGGFTVDLNLNTNQIIVDSGGGNAMSANGAITGTGSLGFNSVMGTSMHVGGTRANTYSGPTLINSGWVNLEKPKGMNALLGTITVGGSSQAKLVWANHNQIDSTADVIVANTSYLSLAGFTNTIHSLTLASGTYVDTGTGGVLTVASLKVGIQSYGGGTYTSSGYSFVTGSGSIVVVPAPAAPIGLTAAGTNLQVSLNWNAVTSATGYNVRRSLANNGFSNVLGRTTGPSVTNYMDTQVTNGVLYWYVVSATNSMGESTNSLAVSARPLPAVAPTPVLLTGGSAGNGLVLKAGTGATVQLDAMGGIKYRLRYANDLLQPTTAWSWVTPPADGWTTASTNGPLLLSDPGATNSPRRYYRPEAQTP